MVETNATNTFDILFFLCTYATPCRVPDSSLERNQFQCKPKLSQIGRHIDRQTGGLFTESLPIETKRFNNIGPTTGIFSC